MEGNTAKNEPTEFEGGEDNEIKVAPEAKETIETGREESTETPVKESKAEETEVEEDKGEKKEVGFSDFLKARGVEIEGIELEKKVEPKKKEFEPRILDDIPEEDRPLFKNMSNESFNKFKPLYLEHKQLKEENETLKNKKPENVASVYGHPQAFTLTPEYAKHTKEYDLAQQIKSHWTLQAAKVSRGEKWQDLDMDPKTGKLILSEPKESNAEAEAFIGDQLQFVREQAFEAGKKLKTYIDGYETSYKKDLEVITSATEKYFPGYSAKDHPTQPVQKAVLDALPASFRDNPVSILLAMTAANNAILVGRLQKSEAENRKLKGIKDDTNKAQPKKGEFVNGKGGGGGVKFSDFANRRAQY